MRCACIDIGSNTTRLLVAECDDAGLRELRQDREFTRIGRALGADGVIPAAKLADVAAAVARQLAMARELGVGEVRIVATASIRRAVNGGELAAAVRATCGVEVRVLPEREEARLAFIGALRAVGAAAGEVGVVDVGGGSTELAVGTAPDRVRWSASLPVGSGELAERFLAADPPTAAELAAAGAYVSARFAPVTVPRTERAVAVGGSATSLHALTGGMLSAGALTRALALLAREPAAVVAQRTGLDPERVRLLPAGLLILQTVAGRFGVALEVGRGGIREALILEMAGF